MRISMIVPFLAAAALVAGCMSGPGDGQAFSEDDVGGHPPEDCECVRVEGSDIGVVGLEVTVGTIDVTFVSWTEKGDAPNEYVGFELGLDGGVPDFWVKAGEEIFTGRGVSWNNPRGSSGPDVYGISHVEICDVDGDSPYVE